MPGHARSTAGKEQLSDTAETLKGVLAQSKISDISLRMFVKQVRVHQNEDKSLELTFELNGSFEDSVAAFVGEENETEILIDYNAPEGFYKDMFGIDVS